MAVETTGAAAAESNIVEVDEITQAVDPADAIQDENGRVIQYHDKTENKIYKVKGAVNPFEAPKPKDEKGESGSASAKKDSPEGDETNKENVGEDNTDHDPDGDENGNEDDEEYTNEAEYILRKMGYDKDEIDFGGDIGKVKISDLTPEQQVIVARQEFDSMIESFEERLKEAESKGVQFEDKQAQQILEYLKEGGDIKKLAKEILSRDPAAQAKMLSDEDIVKMGLKKEFPEFSEEEINEEFKDLATKDGAVARRAKALRTRMEKQQPDFSDLTEGERKAREEGIQAEVNQFKAESENIRKVAKTIKEIAGVPIGDQHREFLLNKVIPSKMEDDSEFIQGLSKPDKLLRLQFLDTYAEKLAEYHYKRGLEAAKAKNGKKDESELSDEPIRTYSGGKGKTKSSTTAKRTIDDFPSFDAFVNAEGKF